MTRELIQLPNKDLWRGYEHKEATATAVEVVPPTDLTPMDRAMLAVTAAAKGAKFLSCLWCGQQFNDSGMREHLLKNHKSIVDPAPDAAIALADKMNAAPAK